MSAGVVDPQGCAKCGIPERGHARQVGVDGSHTWVRPSDKLVKSRMLARRGALPVRAGSVPGLLPEDMATIAALIGDAKPAVPGLLVQLGESVRDVRAHDHSTQCEDWYCLNLTSFMGERMGPVLRRLLDAEARIAELEAERHVTNEALDDAVRELRARKLTGRARLDGSAAAAAEATHWKRLGVEDPYDSPLRHDYRVGRDLPELGGAL